MPSPEITVVVPVGPSKNACMFLPETLASIANQTMKPSHVLVVDDMHGLSENHCAFGSHKIDNFGIWRSPWRLGVAHAFNVGVALAETRLVVMIGADDTFEPTAIERAWNTWQASRHEDAYYYFGVRYMDTDEIQTVPCGEAMVTKGLWDITGGFPVESAVGAPDAALISIMLVYMPHLLIPIANGAPLVNYRRWAETDTASRAPWQGPIIESRNILTNNWKPTRWGRYLP